MYKQIVGELYNVIKNVKISSYVLKAIDSLMQCLMFLPKAKNIYMYATTSYVNSSG